MAQMYPDKEHFDQQHVPSEGERTIYNALRTQLDDGYIVFHSVNWKAQGKKKAYSGEADFVIAHATEGIITLEVKGGGIRYDPANNQWFSLDDDNVEHHIKNPFDQARNSHHTLRKALTDVLDKDQVNRMMVGEAVAFPNTVIDERLPGLDKPPELIVDLHGMSDIAGWLQNVFSYYRSNRPAKTTEPDRHVVETLSKLLVGDGPVLLLVPKWDAMTKETGKLLELTEQQYNILDGFAQHTRLAVRGCAGSGKTMLAYYKATELAEQGQRVLLTCFNRNLADNLRLRADDTPNLHITHFHQLAVEMMNEAGIESYDKRDTIFFHHTLPRLMLQAIQLLPEPRYDVIIVDEAQDFEDSWWEPIQCLLRDMEQSILYIFYDSNQNIFVEQSNFPIQTPPYQLTFNCRNTQHIHQQVLAFYTGSPLPKLRGPQGRPVEVIDISNPQQLQHQLLTKLTDLVFGDTSKIPSDEIVVLTPFAKGKSHLWGKAASTNCVTLTNKPSVSPGKVYCTTIQSFKGLEASVVILAEFERWSHGLEDLKRLLYVACSRARNHLIVFLTDDASDDVRALFNGAADTSV
jgi:hypothetical protein